MFNSHTGTDQLYKDIEMMLGHKPGGIWKIFWKFICPLITLVCLVTWSSFSITIA